jgi:hypothetical protein
MKAPKKLDTTDREAVRRAVMLRLCEIAGIQPEHTKGNLNGQIKACQVLNDLGAPQGALKILGEIAGIDTSRTKGRSRSQQEAARLQKQLLKAAKLDQSRVQ